MKNRNARIRVYGKNIQRDGFTRLEVSLKKPVPINLFSIPLPRNANLI